MGGSVLIVDDDPGTCRLLALLLRHLGHQAAFVDSGGKALEYLSIHRPDLVILDVMMPGIDGLEVLRRMRADPHTVDLPVIMFSAMSDPQFCQSLRDKGANDYWVKASLDFRGLEQRLAAFIPSTRRLDNGAIHFNPWPGETGCHRRVIVAVASRDELGVAGPRARHKWNYPISN